MKHVLTLLLFATFSSIAFAAEEYLPGMFVGTFQGEVFNGNDLDVVVMTIELESSGRLKGEYEVDEEQGAYKGRLSNFRFIDAHTIEMEWTDKFGEGYALMEFARDFDSFVGGWNTPDDERLKSWNGERTSD